MNYPNQPRNLTDNATYQQKEEFEEEPRQDPRTAKEPDNLFPLMGKLVPKAEKG